MANYYKVKLVNFLSLDCAPIREIILKTVIKKMTLAPKYVTNKEATILLNLVYDSSNTFYLSDSHFEKDFFSSIFLGLGHFFVSVCNYDWT